MGLGPARHGRRGLRTRRRRGTGPRAPHPRRGRLPGDGPARRARLQPQDARQRPLPRRPPRGGPRPVHAGARRVPRHGRTPGTALSRLGLAKARARLGRDSAETAAELATLRDQFNRIGLHHAREMVDKAAAELGVGPLPAPGTATATPPDAYRTEALRATDVAGLR
ncbi:hypothetical protein NQP46_01735 [Streptomyces albus]|nr:hypothetical protein NQP46_01735 [Streptomyces albus]